MKNISISVDEDTYRRLRIMAAERGTSLSALIREHMMRVVAVDTKEHTGETENERHRRGLLEITEEFQRKGIGISMKDNLTREQLYQRNAPC